MKVYISSRHLLWFFASISTIANAFSVNNQRRAATGRTRVSFVGSKRSANDMQLLQQGERRQAIASIAGILLAPLIAVAPTPLLLRPLSANAYTPDPDALRESLYLIGRVQEATCLQERYIQKQSPPIKKMKLTLRLVDKNYRLVDQVNYISKFLSPENVVDAVQVGNEAAVSLQDAIDFVYSYQKDGSALTPEQKDFLVEALTETREKLFEFVEYLPDQNKVAEARARVEEENRLNVEEFVDPDLANDAGVFNPIVPPWKNRVIKTM